MIRCKVLSNCWMCCPVRDAEEIEAEARGESKLRLGTGGPSNALPNRHAQECSDDRDASLASGRASALGSMSVETPGPGGLRRPARQAGRGPGSFFNPHQRRRDIAR